MLRMLILQTFIFSLAFSASNAFKIAQKAYDVEDGKDIQATMHMKIHTRSGQVKERTIEVSRKDYGKDNRALFKFKAPALVKGSAFLTWNFKDKDDNDLWLYLPALKKVRRIASSDKHKSFMGSDYSYEDMSKRNLKKDTFKFIKEENHNKVACNVIEASSKDKDEKIKKRKVWIRKDNNLVVKALFYDKKGKIIKELITGGIKKIQNIWTITESTMKNVEKGTKTTLNLSDVKYNNGLSDRLFSHRTKK